MLTLERAKELLHATTKEDHLILHAKNVMVAMEGMARHFGEDAEHWKAIGYLHDYDYEQYPEEHLMHTKEPLLEAGLTEEEVRAILAHGYGPGRLASGKGKRNFQRLSYLFPFQTVCKIQYRDGIARRRNA